MLGVVAVPAPAGVPTLEGLRAGDEVAGFVDCLRAVAVPGTGGFLAVVADDMMRY